MLLSRLLPFIITVDGVMGNILIVMESGAIKGEQLPLDVLDPLKVVVIRVSRELEEDGHRQVCQSFYRGVSLVLDLTWTGWPHVQELSLASGVPYVLLETPLRTMIQAISDILWKIRSATDAILILEDGKHTEEVLYYIVDITTLRVYVLSGLHQGSVQTLKDMRPSPSFYVVLASTRALNSIFNIALESQLGIQRERWYLVFSDFNYTNFNGSKADFTSVYIAPDVCCNFLRLTSPCKCPRETDIFNKIADMTMKEAGQLLKDVLKDMPQAINVTGVDCDSTKATVASNTTRNLFYHILTKKTSSHTTLGVGTSSVIKLYPRISLMVSSGFSGANIGVWNPDTGLVLNQSHFVLPVKRFFRVGVIQAIPWSYRATHPTTGMRLKDMNGIDIWEGYCLDFLKRLASELHFQYELVPSQHFGSRGADGKWDGLVGDLIQGNTDIVVAPIVMTSEREEVIDFVAPYFEQTGISIVVRKPERRTSLFKFMTVLRLEVWLSIVAALIITGVMIWFLDKYSPYSARNNKTLYPYPCRNIFKPSPRRMGFMREFTLKESFWFAMTSFTPQGGGETPKALSGRTLVAAYWLFVVLMLATFTANLAAFLTVERMQTPVQSLEQLSRQSRINYTVVANSDTHKYFKNMKYAEDTLYRIWKEITLNASSDQAQYRVWDYPIKEQYGHILQAIEKTGPVPDATTGFAKVNEEESGWFALIHDSSEIRYEIFRNCNLTEVGESFAEQPYAVAVQQGSQLNEEISRKILELQNERYFESLSAKYWNTSGKGDCFNSEDNEGITLESLGGVFIATLFGLALAMVTLGVEIFFHKRKQKARAKSISKINDFYPEYLSRKEFGTQHLQGKPSTLIHPKTRVITVFPRDQLY